MVLYQPVWADGREHAVGPVRRDAATRYRAIADHLEGRRGFTVLDFGAYGGYFSHRLADEFGAACTAVDDSTHLKPYPGVVAVHRRLNPAGIKKLGPFDVALCLSVLHHLVQWRNYLNTLCEVSDVLFVETAHPDEVLPNVDTHRNSPAIYAEIEKRGGRILTETPGFDKRYLRPLWVIG